MIHYEIINKMFLAKFSDFSIFSTFLIIILWTSFYSQWTPYIDTPLSIYGKDQLKFFYREASMDNTHCIPRTTPSMLQFSIYANEKPSVQQHMGTNGTPTLDFSIWQFKSEICRWKINITKFDEFSMRRNNFKPIGNILPWSMDTIY